MDQVNCKIEGLSPEIRRRLNNKYKVEAPYARHLPAVRLGRWDGKTPYFQMGGSTYINLLPEILQYLDDNNIEMELEDRRPPTPLFEFAAVSERTFAHKAWPKGHPMEGQPILLRDYQIEAINIFLGNLQSMQCVSTGAGKTIITAALSHSVQRYGRSIVVVPNKNLVLQTLVDYENLGLDVGVYFGDRKDMGNQHIICTWQSLSVISKAGKLPEFIKDVVCVMIDEAHTAKGPVLKDLLTGPMANVPIRWGLTGTIPKDLFEVMPLRVSLGEVVNTLSASTLQDEGVLAQCHVEVLQTIEHVEYKNYQQELAFLTGDDERLKWLAQKIQGISLAGNTLVLVDRIASGHRLVELMPGSSFVSGDMKAADRKEHYDEINQGDNSILVATYGTSSTGINIPRIFNVVLLEPGKSFVRVIQSIGRGIRKAKDKDFVQIYDITSSCKFSKRHLTKRKTYYAEANYPFMITKVTR